MGQINSKHVKASNSTGETGTMKKDGYAAGSVPKSMQMSKPGKTNKKGYSGPNVARGTF